MCMGEIIDRRCITSPKRGYKIYDMYAGAGKLVPPFYGDDLNISTSKKWIKAKEYILVTANGDGTYLSGYHIFPSIRDAKKYLDYLVDELQIVKPIILPVLYCGKVSIGIQRIFTRRLTVVSAEWMYIDFDNLEE